MDKELYNKIKMDLENSEVTRANISSLLSNQLIGKNTKQTFTVMYAFYEYMLENGFDFVETDSNWKMFFSKSFSDYVKTAKKEDYEQIISNEKLLSILLKKCDDEGKEKLNLTLEERINSFNEKNNSFSDSDNFSNCLQVKEDVISKLTETSSKIATITKKSCLLAAFSRIFKSTDLNIEEFKKTNKNIVPLSTESLKKTATTNSTDFARIINSLSEKIKLSKMIANDRRIFEILSEPNLMVGEDTLLKQK